jgi:hypothetical protein
MKKIFISHTWSANSLYEALVARFDSILGCANWENISIPKSAAVDLLEVEREHNRDKREKLNNDLWQARAKLADPALRDALSLTVFRDGKLVELPTVASVSREIGLLQSALDELDDPSRELAEAIDHNDGYQRTLRGAGLDKDISRQIRLHPVISRVLHDRVGQSDLIFVLLTGMVWINEWVEHELKIARGWDLPTIGVIVDDGPISPEHKVLFHSIVQLTDEVGIAELLAAV